MCARVFSNWVPPPDDTCGMDHLLSLRSVLDRAHINPAAAEAIIASARPAMAMALAREEDEGRIRIGASKVGGGADLPAGSPWPKTKGVNLRFIAQIDLAEVAGHEGINFDSTLPRSGLLSFFWCQEDPAGVGPDELGGARVMHTPSTSALARLSDPWAAVPQRIGIIGRVLGRKPSAKGQGFWPCRVKFDSRLTLPDPFGPRGIAEGLLSDEEFDEVFGGGLEDELAEAGVLLEGHHLLGEAGPIQGAVEYDAESESRVTPANDPAASAKAAADWQLLLQVNSDDAPGFCFGDWGSIYFMMRNADLAAHRWERARVVVQCH